jgi:hypothetical protein
MGDPPGWPMAFHAFAVPGPFELVRAERPEASALACDLLAIAARRVPSGCASPHIDAGLASSVEDVTACLLRAFSR